MSVSQYDLRPVDGRKSFYGKAYVEKDEMGTETLYSYNTKIMTRYCNGHMVRYYFNHSLSATTLRHIKAFCGLNKKGYLELERVD